VGEVVVEIDNSLIHLGFLPEWKEAFYSRMILLSCPSMRGAKRAPLSGGCGC